MAELAVEAPVAGAVAEDRIAVATQWLNSPDALDMSRASCFSPG